MAGAEPGARGSPRSAWTAQPDGRLVRRHAGCWLALQRPRASRPWCSGVSHHPARWPQPCGRASRARSTGCTPTRRRRRPPAARRSSSSQAGLVARLRPPTATPTSDRLSRLRFRPRACSARSTNDPGRWIHVPQKFGNWPPRPGPARLAGSARDQPPGVSPRPGGRFPGAPPAGRSRRTGAPSRIGRAGGARDRTRQAAAWRDRSAGPTASCRRPARPPEHAFVGPSMKITLPGHGPQDLTQARGPDHSRADARGIRPRPGPTKLGVQ